jgi:hypothetical protein
MGKDKGSARSTGTQERNSELRKHLKEVMEGAAFRGSQRSTQFLQHIVEQTISGNLESLKERAIGVELFGRSPTYDTGDDAIVRVTASDVRKRLFHHYSVFGSDTSLRIHLPLGSYVPEFTRDTKPLPASGSEDQKKLPAAHAVPSPAASDAPPTPAISPTGRRIFMWLAIVVCFLGSNAAMWLLSAQFHSPKTSPDLPWSAMFHNGRATVLVTSDPNIAEIQGLTRSSISVSDYANHNYVPATSSLSPDVDHFIRYILRGDKAANVDTPIVAAISEMAQENSEKISVRAARDFRFSDLDNDNNFIFLGSPRTSPWVTLFDDQLDFRFYFNKDSWQEVIRNVHPRAGEATEYVPTAKGLATGESFATISFVRNPEHAGQVLLLAGANAEGTKAAGELISNLPRLSAVLHQCGISSPKPERHFQILMRLSMMAGSPRTYDVLSCHLLN